MFEGVVVEGVDSGVVVEGTVFWSGVVEGVVEGVDESGMVFGVLLGELGADCEGSVGTMVSPEGLEGVLLGEVGLVVSGVT